MTLSIKGAAVPGWLGVYKNPDGFFVLTIAGHSTVIDQEEADRLARYVDSRYQGDSTPTTGSPLVEGFTG